MKIVWLYLNYEQVKLSGRSIANAIGSGLQLSHAPYLDIDKKYVPKVWVPLVDDLVGLSRSENIGGLSLIIDRADKFLDDNRADFFDLIEAFLTQFLEWHSKRKPCNLFLQIEPNPLVRDIFFHQ